MDWPTALVLTALLLGLCGMVIAVCLCLRPKVVHYSSVERKGKLSEADAENLAKDIKALAADARRMGNDAAGDMEKFADDIRKMAADCPPGKRS